MTPPAFITGIALQKRHTRAAVTPRRAPRHALPVTCATLPPRAQALIQEQIQHPLFDVSKPPVELSGVLSRLQAENAYVSLDDLPDRSAAARAAEAIRVHAPVAIDAARALVLRLFPGIDQEGGALYPEHRAIACWRDLSEFARVVAYGVACDGDVFSDRGVEVMRQVYQELEVPIDAMTAAVARVGQEIAQREDEGEVKVAIGVGFARLLEVLEKF